MVTLPGKASDFLKIAVAAAGRGDRDAVESVLEQRPEWLNRIGAHGRTMLWEAAYCGRLDMVRYLADAGADTDAWGCHFSPLLVEVSPYCAASFKKHDAVAEYLRAGSDQNERGLDIFSASFLGDGERVTALLDDDPDLANRERPQHDPNVVATSLHYAVSAGHVDILELLLQRGANPLRYSQWIIRFAIWRDRPDILKLLLAAGADASATELPRVGVDNPEILALLAANGANIEVDRAEGGWPPLVFQCRGDRGGNLDRVAGLLDQGADVNVRNHKGQSALHCAAKAGFTDIVALLLEHGARVDAEDASGETPLAAALRSTVKDRARLRSVLSLLMDAGANPDHEDQRGRTPAGIARRKRDRDVWLDAIGVS